MTRGDTVPTVHAARRRLPVAALPWIALVLSTACCLALAFLSQPPLRTAWALLGLGCGALLLLWVSLRPTGIHARTPAGEE